MDVSTFKTQFRGYDKKEVDKRINELEDQVNDYYDKVKKLEEENTSLRDQNTLLSKQINVNEKTNEEIARLALKEASDLIEKAKRNANMILKESMEYVRGISKDMDTFKKDAVDFRKNVVKLSEDMLETIDKSEIFSLIKEEQNADTETEKAYKENF